jgi:hypothetical protein
MEYMYDAYCNMLLPFGYCNNWAGTATSEYALRCLHRRHPDANVFLQLEQCLYETGSVKPMALVNAGCHGLYRYQPMKMLCAAVEGEPC